MSLMDCHLRKRIDGEAGKNRWKMGFLHLCNLWKPGGITRDIVGIS